MTRAALPKLTAEHRRLLGEYALARLQLDQLEAKSCQPPANSALLMRTAVEHTLTHLLGVLCGRDTLSKARELLDWEADEASPMWTDQGLVRFMLSNVHDQLAQLAPKGQPHAYPAHLTQPVVTGRKGIM